MSKTMESDYMYTFLLINMLYELDNLKFLYSYIGDKPLINKHIEVKFCLNCKKWGNYRLLKLSHCCKLHKMQTHFVYET